jgi:hypothetical protein
MHFTPTGSSWINQVERWFGFLAERIRRGARLRAWVTDWNEDPKPFIWTKTAEETLDSLARFYQRISGAGHQYCSRISPSSMVRGVVWSAVG